MSQLATQTTEKNIIEFVPFGAAESIKLSIKIVRDLVAQPTAQGKLPDDRECMRFMMLCRARHLNPFEGDAYLLGYDGRNGPQFSLITAHQVFLKRAEASTQFDGMESGIVIETDNGIEERETDFILKGETLLGGWAKVFRKDRSKPFYRRVNLSTFTTGRSRWEKDPAGMICKCAEADALRSAFPSHLGGLYSEQEIDTKPVNEPSKPLFQDKTAKFLEQKKPEAAEVLDAEFEPETPQVTEHPHTKLEALQNLLSNTGISIEQYTAHLRKISFLGAATEIPQLSDKKLDQLIANFVATAEEIRKEEAQ